MSVTRKNCWTKNTYELYYLTLFLLFNTTKYTGSTQIGSGRHGVRDLGFSDLVLALSPVCQDAKWLKSKKIKNHIIMHVSPWPGDRRLILLQLQRAEEDFRGGCSERIRVKRSHAFGPPRCYQISADSLPAAPRALEHITSWEGKGRLAEFYVCGARRRVRCSEKGRNFLGLVGRAAAAAMGTNSCHLKVAAPHVGETRRANVCEEPCGTSDSCILSAGEKPDGWKWDVNKTRMKPIWNKDKGSSHARVQAQRAPQTPRRHEASSRRRM